MLGRKEKTRPVPELSGSSYAGKALKGVTTLNLPATDLGHVVNMLTLGAPGNDTDKERAERFLTALKDDVEILLAANGQDFKPAFKSFTTNYREILRLNGSRRDWEGSAVLLALKSHLVNKIAALKSSNASPEPLPAAETFPSCFDADATLHAYEIIHNAHAEKWGKLEAEELASTGRAPLLEQAPEAVRVVARPAPQPETRGQRAIQEEVNAMHRLNNGFREWLEARNIEVVPSSGRGEDCLINSVQQHITGNYHIRGFENSRWRELVKEQGALHSDTEETNRMVREMNRHFETDVEVVIVSTDEESRPRIISRTGTGANPVVIWQQGEHYEALRFRSNPVAPVEASRKDECEPGPA